MWQPSFIKMQRVDFAIEHLFNHLNVVDDAVIGALSQRHYARHNVFVLDERISINLLLDVFPFKLFFWNRTNDAQVITGRH